MATPATAKRNQANYCSAASWPVQYAAARYRRKRMPWHEFDGDYVNRLIAGDPTTEAHFVEYFTEILECALRSRVRQPDLRTDMRQETFVRVLNALRNKHSLEHPERLGGFVLSVGRNVYRELLRKDGRFTGLPESESGAPDPRDNPEGLLVSAERKAIVRRILDKLSPKDRALLSDVMIEGMSKDDACQKHGVTRDYLRVLLFRARQRFRTELERSMVKTTGGGLRSYFW